MHVARNKKCTMLWSIWWNVCSLVTLICTGLIKWSFLKFMSPHWQIIHPLTLILTTLYLTQSHRHKSSDCERVLEEHWLYKNVMRKVQSWLSDITNDPIQGLSQYGTSFFCVKIQQSNAKIKSKVYQSKEKLTPQNLFMGKYK